MAKNVIFSGCDIILSWWVSICLWSCWIDSGGQFSRKSRKRNSLPSILGIIFVYDKIGYDSIIFSLILLFLVYRIIYPLRRFDWPKLELKNDHNPYLLANVAMSHRAMGHSDGKCHAYVWPKKCTRIKICKNHFGHYVAHSYINSWSNK